MNRLTRVNHASWAKWPRLRSPEQWSEQPTCWKSYIPMCAVQWVLRLTEDIVMFSLSQMTWVDMGMSTWWNTSLRPLKSSRNFQNEVENQRDRKIKFLRSDGGGEYLSHEFGTHLKKCGIVSQLTPPGTPQRNGVSERCNHTLLDMVRLWCILPIYRSHSGAML